MRRQHSNSNWEFFKTHADLQYGSSLPSTPVLRDIGHVVANYALKNNKSTADISNVQLNMNTVDFPSTLGTLEYSNERTPTELLPMELYGHWFRAIMEDDVTYATDLLNSSATAEAKRLLNGRFLFELGHQSKVTLLERQCGMTCVFERPLTLTIMFRSHKMFELLVNMNVNVFNAELDGSNIAHALVWAASQHQESHEDDYCRFFGVVMARLGYNSRKRILLSENNAGLRPLELAMKMNTFKLAQNILNTEGVYCRTQAQMGAHVCVLYDVTDYEKAGNNRRHLSPLKFVTLLEKENLCRLQHSGLLSHPLFERWIHNKITISVPYLVIWCVVRLLYTLLFFISTINASYMAKDRENTTFAVEKVNATRQQDFVQYHYFECPEGLFYIPGLYGKTIYYITLAFSGVIILFDVIEAIYQITYRRKLEAPCYNKTSTGNFVVKTRFYRYCNFLLAVAVAIYISTLLAGPNYIAVTSKAYIAATILNVWSLLFFIQFLPTFGYFVIIVQRMLKDMFNFLVLYLVLFFTFSQAFYNLLRMQGHCTEAFASLDWSLYSTFRVMLNMLDLTLFIHPDSQTDVAILHSTYIIIVPILLVNFLIALMSNSVAEVAENRRVIMKLQRLQAALLSEHRLRTVFAHIFRQQKSRLFAVRDEKIHVECLMFRPK